MNPPVEEVHQREEWQQIEVELSDCMIYQYVVIVW